MSEKKYEPHELWQTRENKILVIDEMDGQHAKNALKLLLKSHYGLIIKHNKLIDKYKSLKTHGFALKGDMAVDFNENFPSNDDFDPNEGLGDWEYWKD